ncbi:MAG: hypothetical protein IIB77_13965 [Proteobacteria bacterium]|nr:hypothetical protein [Pseudomonadota bacterium]
MEKNIQYYPTKKNMKHYIQEKIDLGDVIVDWLSCQYLKQRWPRNESVDEDLCFSIVKQHGRDAEPGKSNG